MKSASQANFSNGLSHKRVRRRYLTDGIFVGERQLIKEVLVAGRFDYQNRFPLRTAFEFKPYLLEILQLSHSASHEEDNPNHNDYSHYNS